MKRSPALVVFVLSTLAATAARADPSATLYAGGDHLAAPRVEAGGDDASGQATASVPLVFPPGRRGGAPRIALSYRHAGGPSEVGEGWSLNLPVIERRGIAASSTPSFTDDDHFYFAGQRLIKVGIVANNQVSGAAMPIWANQWTLYRPMVEHANTRVFLKSDKRTWVVQLADGGLLEFGAPWLIPGGAAAHDIDACDATRIVRWKLVLESDSDVVTNPIVYRWAVPRCDRPALLSDVYYTHSPADGLAATAAYAHHVQLDYAAEQEAELAYQPVPAGLRQIPHLQVKRIAIATRNASTSSGARERVRSYRLEYVRNRGGRAFLQKVTLVGRCGDGQVEQLDQPSGITRTSRLPDDAACPSRPPYEFTYSADHAYEHSLDGSAGVGAHNSIYGENGPLEEPIYFDNFTIADANRDGFPDILSVGNGSRRVFVSRGTTFDTASFVTLGIAPFHNTADGTPAFAPLGSSEPIFGSLPTNLTIAGTWAAPAMTEFLSRAASAPEREFPRRLLRVEGDGSSGFSLREVQSGYGGAIALGNPHAFGDLDGDGLTDALYIVVDDRISDRGVHGTDDQFD